MSRSKKMKRKILGIIVNCIQDILVSISMDAKDKNLKNIIEAFYSNIWMPKHISLKLICKEWIVTYKIQSIFV